MMSFNLKGKGRNDVVERSRSRSSSTVRTSSRNSVSPSRQMASPSARHSPSRSSTSRLSMTSSIVTLATSENDRGSDFQPLYSSRWSEETEMDKSLKILKRKQAASIRLRKMNDVYDRLLEGKLKLLSSDFSNLSKELKKETQSIKEEISDNPPKSRFPRIDSVTPSGPSRQPSSTNGRGHGENVCQSCLFDPANTTGRCKHFPCFLPMTYNSIGVFPKPQTYSVVSNYKQLVQRCGDLRPPTSKRQTIIEESAEVNTEQESRAPRTNVKEKIRGLKQLVKEMKERNDKTKPRDWAINYGDPLPRRVILKPVKTA